MVESYFPQQGLAHTTRHSVWHGVQAVVGAHRRISPEDQRAFHDHLFEVVCVAVAERQKLDWKLKLMFKLNSMVSYSENLV